MLNQSTMESALEQGKAHDLFISVQSLDRTHKGTPPFLVTVRCDSLGYLNEDGGIISVQENFLKRLANKLGHLVDSSAPAVELAGIGKSLFDELFPNQLQEMYWEFCGKVQNILIVSEETWIPWQLIKPYRGTIEDDFLGEKFIVSRWWPHHKILLKQISSISPLGVVVDNLRESHPLSALPHAGRERAFLVNELNGVKVVVIPPLTSSFYDELRRGGVSAFHIACHTDYDSNMELCEICLEDGRVRAMSISGEYARFGEDVSLFFLNTCGIARPESGFSESTGATGFVPALIKANVKAVICTHWDISDEKAPEFTKIFYTELLNGRCIGDAFHNAQQAIKTDSDPTWLSYTLFGDPFGRITISS